HPLAKVFVELALVKDRDRPSSHTQATYLELMDQHLRQRRNPFARDEDRVDPGVSSADQKPRTVRPEELLRPHTHAVIVGAPGTGKSTLFRYLVSKVLLTQAERLPVFLELKRLTEDDLATAHGRLEDLAFAKAVAEPLRLEGAARASLHQLF